MANTDQERLKQFDSRHYVRPHLAYRKLKKAEASKSVVWIYGASGYGKTALINSYFESGNITYFSAEHLCVDDLKELTDVGEALVIDDLQLLIFPDIYSEIWKEIERIALHKDIWLILISRGKIPGRLNNVSLSRQFEIIEESDFELSRAEIKKLLSSWNVTLTNKQLEELERNSMRHAKYIDMVAAHLAQGDEYRIPLLKIVQQELWDYLELYVYEQWEPEIQEFLLKLSVVDSFTIPLAKMITGRNDAEYMLRYIMKIGNFLIEHINDEVINSENNDTVYEMRMEMLLSTRRWINKKYDEAEIKMLYTNAGMYYELNGQTVSALDMYQRGGATERMRSLLVDNSRKNPGVGYFFELRRFYFAIPEEEIRHNPDLMSGMSMLHSLLLNTEESERWYGELKNYAESNKGSLKRYSKSLLLYLDIALPHRGSVNLADIFLNAVTILKNRNVILPELGVTSNLPSIMNGGKDFCEWSKKDTEFANGIGKVVAFVLGKYGKGFINLALAENYLEKGTDRYEVASLLATGRMQADSGGKIELVFVADGLMAWLSVFDGKISVAKDRLESFYKKAESEHAYKLLVNIETFIARLDLYAGNTSAVSGWMETAPDENVEFITVDRFHYLTKVRIYISMGKYELATELLYKLLYYADVMKRTYIRIECELLLAIARYRMGQSDWDETFINCLSKAEEYHFVRIITREGAAVEPLLYKTKWKEKDSGFRKLLMEENAKMVRLYPGYLKEKVDEVLLSENALAVLKLQAEGFSVTEIAKRLNIQVGTVKYHCTQTYRKLGVKDKAGAVTEAYKRGLI